MAGSRFSAAGSGLLRQYSAVCWAVMVAHCRGAAPGGGGLFAAALGSPSLAARLARSSRAGGCVDARRRWILGSPNLVPPCEDLAPQCGPIGHRSQVRLSLLSVGWASGFGDGGASSGFSLTCLAVTTTSGDDIFTVSSI